MPLTHFALEDLGVPGDHRPGGEEGCRNLLRREQVQQFRGPLQVWSIVEGQGNRALGRRGIAKLLDHVSALPDALLISGHECRFNLLGAGVYAGDLTVLSMNFEYSDKWPLPDHRYPLAGGVGGQWWTEALTGRRKNGDVIEMG